MLPRFKYTSLTVTAIFIAFLTYGCGESRIVQCNKLSTIANQAKTLTTPSDAEGFDRLADAIEKIADRMRAVKLEDAKLKDLQGQFANIYAESARAARGIGKAYSAKKSEEIAKITKETKSIGNRESSLIGETNKYCAAP
jgi:lipopolysaccharide export LptBFGC system permease protein LptF